MITSGVMLGLMINLRQPLMAAACLVLFLYLIFYCVKKRDSFIKRALQAIGGLLIPVSIICIYLISNGAFGPMLEQVFLDTSYKGSSPLNIIFMPFVLILKDHYALLLLLFAVALLLFVFK